MSVTKILALTDLSENSEPGLAWAGTLALRFGAEVVAGFIETRFDQFASLTGGERENAVRLAAVVRDQSARHLEELTDKHVPAKCRAGIELSEHHSVREGIAELVERVQPDVVCLASHGRTGLEHVVLGSIAEHTLRTAGVPVMVVKKTAPPAADEPLRVLIALDFGERTEKLVGEAAKLLRPEDELALVHVVESIYWAPRPQVLAPYLRYANEFSLPQPDVPRLREASLEHMRRIPLPDPAPNVTRHVATGKPGEEIVALQKELGAHVTVVHTHGRRGFDRLMLGSVAERVTRRCEGAVYVVPAG